MSFYTLAIGLGSFVTGVVTRAVTFSSRTNYFLFWAAFMLAGAVLFAIVSALYKPVKVTAAPEHA